MYKKHLIIIMSLGLFAFVISYALRLRFDKSLLNSIMTVLSIIFGFNTTAVSTLYSKSFIANLHKKVDEVNKGQTQLQTLKQYFSMSCKLSLSTIMYLILYQLFEEMSKAIISSYLDVELFLSSLILSLVSINIFVLLFLLKVFLKGLISEALVDTTK